MPLVSAAIEKLREDGLRSLLFEGIPWLYRKFRWRGKKWYTRTVARRFLEYRYETVREAEKYTYIDPRDINYYLLNSDQTFSFCDVSLDVPLHEMEKGRFTPSLFTGIVLPGDWDRYKKPYEFDRVYRGLRPYDDGEGLKLEEFDRGDGECDGEGSEQTEYLYQYALREELRDDEGYLERQIENTQALYDEIQENGFLTQYELGAKADGKPVSARPWGVTVNVGRNGELIFNNTAHHRLAISRLLGIETIPVLVVVRHQKWQSLREEVRRADTGDQLSQKAMQHLAHPDLREFALESGSRRTSNRDTLPGTKRLNRSRKKSQL